MFKTFSPLIISASRATDIPAFYGDWFINRLKDGFVLKQNPFNNQKYKISFNKTQLFVFWTKDPAPFFEKLEFLNKYYPNYYFQYTLNNYNKSIEINIPCLNKRIDTFIELSEKIGKEKVIWRFDPLILSDKINSNDLADKVEFIAEKINNYTNKLVFSFIDLNIYKRVQRKINHSGIKIKEFRVEQKIEFAQKIANKLRKYNLEITTCAEDTNLSEFGIQKNKCIDDNLIRDLFADNEELMEFINQNKNLKDKGQRKFCGCIESKDIGMYNTCIHSCVYCYAITSRESAFKNYLTHNSKKFTESII